MNGIRLDDVVTFAWLVLMALVVNVIGAIVVFEVFELLGLWPLETSE